MQCTDHMRVFLFINNSRVVQFDVQILIYGVQGSLNGQVVFELYCDLQGGASDSQRALDLRARQIRILKPQYLFAYKRLEVRVKQHRGCSFPRSLARSHVTIRCEDTLQSQ